MDVTNVVWEKRVSFWPHFRRSSDHFAYGTTIAITPLAGELTASRMIATLTKQIFFFTYFFTASPG